MARVLNDMLNKSASFETLFEKLREVAPDCVRNPKVESFATCISEARSRSSGGTPIMVVSTFRAATALTITTAVTISTASLTRMVD